MTDPASLQVVPERWGPRTLEHPWDRSGDHPADTRSDQPGTAAGTIGDHGGGRSGTRGGPYKGTPWPLGWDGNAEREAAQ